MTTYHARNRRNRGAWLDALLLDQAEATGMSIDDLRDFVVAVAEVKHALVAVDNPAPARGYAIVLPRYITEAAVALENTAVVRLHMLAGQDEAAYRALFSQALVQARYLRSGEGLPYEVELYVDSTTLSSEARAAVESFGGAYGLRLGRALREELVTGEPKPELIEAPQPGELESASGEREDDEGTVEEGPQAPEEEPQASEPETVEEVEEAAPDYVSMTKAQLIDAAKALGVSASGTAPELRQRLMAL